MPVLVVLQTNCDVEDALLRAQQLPVGFMVQHRFVHRAPTSFPLQALLAGSLPSWHWATKTDTSRRKVSRGEDILTSRGP